MYILSADVCGRFMTGYTQYGDGRNWLERGLYRPGLRIIGTG